MGSRELDTPDHCARSRRAAGIEEPRMWCVYAIRLGADREGNSKYYVGATHSLMSRIHNHAMGNERSSAWVRRWGYSSLCETRYCVDEASALFCEVALCTEYKVKYGWTHVRGGQDCRSDDGAQGRPRYWEAPDQGTERTRVRSRSPPRPESGE